MEKQLDAKISTALARQRTLAPAPPLPLQGAPVMQLPPGWGAATAPGGAVYYVSAAGTSQWEPPVAPAGPAPAVVAPAVALAAAAPGEQQQQTQQQEQQEVWQWVWQWAWQWEGQWWR